MIRFLAILICLLFGPLATNATALTAEVNRIVPTTMNLFNPRILKPALAAVAAAKPRQQDIARSCVESIRHSSIYSQNESQIEVVQAVDEFVSRAHCSARQQTELI